MEDTLPAPESFTCPSCNQDVEVQRGEVAQVVPCPHCGWEFLVPSVDGSTDLPEDLEAMEEERRRQEELDALRARQAAKGKRGVNSQRNWTIAGMLMCAVAVVYIPLWGLRHRLAGEGNWRLWAAIPLSLAALMASVFLYRRARELRGEATRPLPEPEGPPDFSTLGEGAPPQAWQRLEELGRPDEGEKSSQ